ncbi:MAG: tetratricopeptide repeat protein, partial [candidate division WOR-3 bacterium]
FIRDKILLKVLNALAIIFNRFGNKDMAFNCYEIAIKKAAEFKDKNQIATIYLNLGYDYLNLKGDYEKAEECFNKSLRIRESLKDPIGIAGVYQGFAYLFMVRGNMEKSLQFYIKAREVFLEIKKMRDLYVTEQNIANILANKCLFREAEKYYLISLERMEKTLNPYDIVLGKLNYSTMLLSLKKLKESRQLLEEALLISEKINYGLAISYIYSNLAIIKFVNKEKNYEEFMEKAIFYAKGIIVHEEHITLRKARLLYFMGKYEDFKKLLLELEGRIKNLQDLKLKLEVMILKTFLLKEEEKEMHLLSLLKDTRETGNDRILLKILYLLKDIRNGTEYLYYNFLNKVSIYLSEEEKEGLIEMLLLI